MNEQYLGDSVYAQLDGEGRLMLTTDSHLQAEAGNTIYLEPEIAEALYNYIDRMMRQGPQE
jgi:hypothetical protein